MYWGRFHLSALEQPPYLQYLGNATKITYIRQDIVMCPKHVRSALLLADNKADSLFLKKKKRGNL